MPHRIGRTLLIGLLAACLTCAGASARTAPADANAAAPPATPATTDANAASRPAATSGPYTFTLTTFPAGRAPTAPPKQQPIGWGRSTYLVLAFVVFLLWAGFRVFVFMQRKKARERRQRREGLQDPHRPSFRN
jgi:hypothetical protein